MSGGQTFVISFLTAIVVSVVVHLGFRQLELADPASIPEEESSETVTVPNLSGLNVETARARLAQLKLHLGSITEVESDTIPKGQVVSTVPERFTQVQSGVVVGLTVSVGVSEVEVPNVRRLNQKKAMEKLKELGLEVEVKKIYNEDFMFDRVLNQNPKAGEKIKKGDTVTIMLNIEEEYY